MGSLASLIVAVSCAVANATMEEVVEGWERQESSLPNGVYFVTNPAGAKETLRVAPGCISVEQEFLRSSDNWSGRVFCINRRYGFELSRPGADEPWVLLALLDVGDESVRDIRRRIRLVDMDTRRLGLSPRNCHLPELVNAEGVRVELDESPAEGLVLQLNVPDSVQLEGKPPVPRQLRCHLAPEFNFLVRKASIDYGTYQVDWENLDFRPLGEAFLPARVRWQTTGAPGVVTEFTLGFEAKELPESEFLLTLYGLPEPPEFGRRGLLWAWVLAGCLAFGGALLWYSPRRRASS